ncbi:MAG: NifU family protein [Alphaproteobacteria bacterium]|tara:strand:- start:2662 stop:3225 length:564 start_codon:yes stop_codon:yes gene_type:complete
MFIQTEETPNPATLKFLPGRIILEDGTLDFKKKDDAKGNKLAVKLFTDKNVNGVFIGKDFLTVTKSNDVNWDDLKPTILSIILDFFSSGGVIESNSEEKKLAKTKYTKEEAKIVDEIKKLLDERIKPAVAQDGGDINFVKYKKRVVFLELRGACSGCPSSTITLKSGIENMLKYYIPEIDSVEAINQ